MPETKPACCRVAVVHNPLNDKQIVLVTVRDEVRISVDEAERLACELFRVAREVRNEDV